LWAKDWRSNLVALAFGQMLSIAGFNFFIPLLPLFFQKLGASGTTEAVQWAGATNAMGSLAMVVAQPYWGAMADRWGRKPMVIRSMLGSGLTTLLLAVASSPEQLLALYVLQGLVTGTVAASTALVAGSMPRQHLGFALGMLQVAIFVGASCGPLGGGLVADALGFRAAFLVAGSLLVLGALVVSALVRENFVPPPLSERRRSFWSEGRTLLAIALFPLLAVVIFLIQFGNAIMGPVVSLYISSLEGADNVATAVGMVMGATGAMSAVSAFVIGRLGDRVGHRPILLICLAGAALSYFPQAMVGQVWQLLMLRMLLGCFLGGLMPSANALVAGVVPREKRGAAFGITSSSAALSQTVAPVFSAGVASFLGLRAVFLAAGAIYTLALLWAASTFRRHSAPARLQGQSPQRGRPG